MPQFIGRAMTSSMSRISDNAPQLTALASAPSPAAHADVDAVNRMIRAAVLGSGNSFAEVCASHRRSQRMIAELAWDDDDEGDDFIDEDDDEDLDEDEDDDDDFDDLDEDEDDEDEDDDDFFDDEDEDEDDEDEEPDLEDDLDEDEVE